MNRVFGGYFLFTKTPKEPAGIFAWRWLQLSALTGAGWCVALYAKFVKGYNILWFIAPFCPFWTFALYNWVRQPDQGLENCYKYLLAKRTATCELEKHN